MDNKPVHATAVRTLRHWTVSDQKVVGGSQRPAPALAYSEQAAGGGSRRLASALARVKSELARRVSASRLATE